MSTLVANGSAVSPGSFDAAEEAIGQALSGLSGGSQRSGLIFAGPDHRLSDALLAAKRRVPGAQLFGCSSAGEFTQAGLTHGGIAVVLVASDELVCRLNVAAEIKREPVRAAARLADQFSEIELTARDKGYSRSTTLLLVDGLAGTGERIVEGLLEQTRAFQQIVGGAAGDEGRFLGTQVGDAVAVGPERAAASTSSAEAVGGGVRHGLRATSKKMTVTKSEGNLLHELDGRPAFEAYVAHAKAKGVTLTKENASPYLIANEIGVYLFGELGEARAPLSVGSDGSLSCAAPVPSGRQVCILDGDRVSMVNAARQAATEAREALVQSKPAGAIVFDCVCRGMILKENFQEEIDAIRDALGGVPVTGFLTYGEIARYGGSLSGWHNATAVVLAIPE